MEPKGNSVLCTISEAIKISEEMQRRVNEEICSLQFLFGCPLPLSAKIVPKIYVMGCGVEADLYYDGEFFRHYSIPEELLLDLTHLSMKKIIEKRESL